MLLALELDDGCVCGAAIVFLEEGCLKGLAWHAFEVPGLHDALRADDLAVFAVEAVFGAVRVDVGELHRPPGRTSICSMVILYFRGPIHWERSLASVYARNTRSRGASNVLSIRISVSLGVVITAGFDIDCEAFIANYITIWLYNYSVNNRSISSSKILV